MGTKISRRPPAPPREAAQQVFRRFAWNLAGALARPAGGRRGRR